MCLIRILYEHQSINEQGRTDRASKEMQKQYEWKIKLNLKEVNITKHITNCSMYLIYIMFKISLISKDCLKCQVYNLVYFLSKIFSFMLASSVEYKKSASQVNMFSQREILIKHVKWRRSSFYKRRNIWIRAFFILASNLV